MKKVIGVAVAASLLAGMAFADVAVSLNARLRSNMYHQKKINSDTTKTWMFDLDASKNDVKGGTGANAYDHTHGGSGAMSDTLKFSAKNDYAGVTLETTGQPNKENITGNTCYNGFIKFDALTFTFGTFDSRNVSIYDVSAGESGLLKEDITKYGVVNGDDYNLTKDANNFSTVGGTKVVSLVADYTVDMGDGSLLLKGGLLSNKYDDDAEGSADNKKYQNAGYAFEGDFENDAVKLQALFKLPAKKQTVFGVFADVKALPLPVAVGFSYGSDGNDGDAKHTEMAFDARVGYDISDAAKITSAIKYESVKPDGGDNETALSIAAEVSYIVSDMTTVFADVGYYNYDLDGSDDDGNSRISIRPGVVLTAGKGAQITAALQYDKYTAADDQLQSDMSIPVIFRVKF